MSVPAPSDHQILRPARPELPLTSMRPSGSTDLLRAASTAWSRIPARRSGAGDHHGDYQYNTVHWSWLRGGMRAHGRLFFTQPVHCVIPGCQTLVRLSARADLRFRYSVVSDRPVASGPGCDGCVPSGDRTPTPPLDFPAAQRTLPTPRNPSGRVMRILPSADNHVLFQPVSDARERQLASRRTRRRFRNVFFLPCGCATSRTRTLNCLRPAVLGLSSR